MAIEDVKILIVNDTGLFGDLIRDIATKKEPRPAGIEALNKLLLKRKIVEPPTPTDIANNYEPHWPNGRASKLEYVEFDDDVLMVTIPTANSLDAGVSLAKSLSLGEYPLPRGYDIAYTAGRKPELRDEEWEEIYRTRIGDYTIGKCM